MQPYDYDDMPMWEYWENNGVSPIPIWAMALMMIIGGLVVIAIMVALLVFLKKEAGRRNINNVEIWVLIFLGLNVVGLIVYLIMRDIYPLKEPVKQEVNVS